MSEAKQINLRAFDPKLVVYFSSHSWLEVMNQSSVPLQKLKRTRQETEDVKEYKLEDLIIVHCYQFDNEMVAVKLSTSTHVSEIESVESKVENEMLSVKMHLAKTNTWNQVRSGDDVEKLVSDDVKETLAEATQLLENVSEQSIKSFLIYETLKMRKEVHQITERREVFCTRSLETAQLESRAAEEAKDEEAAKDELIIGQ